MLKDLKLCEKMTKEDFCNYLDLLKDRGIFLDSIYKKSNGNLDLNNFNDFLMKPYSIIEKNFFNDWELEYINWYLWEDVEKKIYDAKTHEVIADINSNEALWDYLNQDSKTFVKELDEILKEANERFDYLLDMFN